MGEQDWPNVLLKLTDGYVGSRAIVLFCTFEIFIKKIKKKFVDMCNLN